jgi:glyoxylase-like metal-dependent hydrolase (beta-lactamase superfamily II)
MVVRLILSLFKFSPVDRFTPDLLIDEGYDLSSHGFDFRVLHIPGHSNGSLGILTPSGDLLCGDLLTHFRQPAPGMGLFDRAEFEATLEKLKQLTITTVYPGHGKPFAWEQFAKQYML